MSKMSNSRLIALLALCLVATACSSDRKILVQPAARSMDPDPIALPGTVVAPAADPMAVEQWAARRVGADAVWAAGTHAASRRVVVGLLGSGVDYNHEDLRPNVLVRVGEAIGLSAVRGAWKNRVDDDGNGYVDDLVGYDFVGSDGLPYDHTGTGTAMAGIVAAVHQNGKGIRGIASAVSLLPVRFIDANGQSSVARLIEALKYALANSVDLALVHLPNLDFAHGVTPAAVAAKVAKLEEVSLTDVLAKLQARGIPLIVSAGNSGASLSSIRGVMQRVASFDNVLVVTTVDDQDRRPFVANYGMQVVDTSAPGQGVLTTLPGSRYGLMSGTAIAAAHVAGAVALAQSRHYGQLDYRRFFAELMSERGSERLTAAPYDTLGGNRLQIARFLDALEAP